MPRFCDCLRASDPWKHEQQLSVIRAFMGRGWQPPQEDGGVTVDAKLESIDEIEKEMKKKPKGRQAILGPGGE